MGSLKPAKPCGAWPAVSNKEPCAAIRGVALLHAHARQAATKAGALVACEHFVCLFQRPPSCQSTGCHGDARRTNNLEHLGSHAGGLIGRDLGPGHESMPGRVVAQKLSVETVGEQGTELERDVVVVVNLLVGSIPSLPSTIDGGRTACPG